MTITAAHPNNQVVIVVDTVWSNGALPSLPSDAVLVSDNPAVTATWMNMGDRTAWIRLIGPAPQTANITVSSASQGANAPVQTVVFSPAPPVTVTFTWNETLSAVSQG